MSVNTPLMGLQKPTIGVDSGLTWEQDTNNNTDRLDAHNHAPGQGAQIPPSGLNINATLNFNNNQASTLQAVAFTQQASLATLNALFVRADGNLYFNDGASDPSIQITKGGSVNATSSGISSGSATASFVLSVLVVNAEVNTPADIQGGSLLLGNNVASSKFLTLQPPSAMGANYSLTLPSLPAQTNVMTLDTSGNMASTTYDAIGQAMTSVGANAIANTRTRATGTTVGIGGIAVSASSGANNITSTTFIAVTNLSVTLTTGGRPVYVSLIPDGSAGNVSRIGCATSAGVSSFLSQFQILNGSTAIATEEVSITNSAAPTFSSNQIPCSALNTTDLSISGAAGTYTYTVQALTSNASAIANISWVKLIAYEL